jgi:hypothetical protein
VVYQAVWVVSRGHLITAWFHDKPFDIFQKLRTIVKIEKLEGKMLEIGEKKWKEK